MIFVPSCSWLCSIRWSQPLSQEWRCSWSSADGRCFNYIWVINNFIAYSYYMLDDTWKRWSLLGPVSLRLMTSQDIVIHGQKKQDSKMQHFGWNFNQNVEPIHCKICILRGIKNLTGYGVLQFWHFKSLWDGNQDGSIWHIFHPSVRQFMETKVSDQGMCSSLYSISSHNIPKCMKEETWLKLCQSTNGHRSAALEWLLFILPPVFVQAAVIRSW